MKIFNSKNQTFCLSDFFPATRIPQASLLKGALLRHNALKYKNLYNQKQGYNLWKNSWEKYW